MVTLNVLYALSYFTFVRVRSFLMNAVFASFSIVAKYVFIMSSDGCLIAFECHFCIFLVFSCIDDDVVVVIVVVFF